MSSAPRRLGLSRHETLGALLLLVVFGGSIAIFAGLPGRLSGGPALEIKADFAGTAKLSVGDPVRIDGVKVGSVRSISAAPERRATRVVLALDDDPGPLHRDARAAITWRTALGGSYAVVLERGNAGGPALGDAVIPVDRTERQVELDEVLSAVGSGQRDGLRTMLDEVPRALRTPTGPADALDALADASPAATEGLSALRGEEHRDLRRLVTNTAAATAALSDPAEDLRALVAGAGTTLSVTGRRAAEIRAAIRAAAVTAPVTTVTMRRLEGTLAAADRLVADLRDPVGKVAPTIAALRPVVLRADRLLRTARPLVRNLRPTVTSLASAARQASPVIEAVSPSVERLDDTILPALAVPDPVTGRPTYQMVGPTVAGLEGAASGFDSSGFTFRFGASSNERAIDTAPCKTYFTDPTATQLASCEALLSLLPAAPSARGSR